LARTDEGQFLRYVDGELQKLWKLGRNVIIGWCAERTHLSVLVVPQFLLAEFFADHDDILSGSSQMTSQRMAQVADLCEIEPYQISIPATLRAANVRTSAIERLVRRYSVRRSDARGAVLFDIVNFSLYSPLEQVTALNSLAYSINVAQQRAAEQGVKVALARSTTGDGFYIWNRNDGISADIDLFCLMMLVLADNAVARQKSRNATVPVLRVCFHVGPTFEYFQAEGVNPAMHSYIVGDLTIDLSRMIGKAMPGQALIGDFAVRPAREGLDVNLPLVVDTPLFVAAAWERLEAFRDVVLSRETISSLKCYLTGQRLPNGKFNIIRYQIRDKHGLNHYVFNAKFNIYRDDGEPIYLGLQSRDLAEFDAEELAYESFQTESSLISEAFPDREPEPEPELDAAALAS
jgi:hypothetical protein